MSVTTDSPCPPRGACDTRLKDSHVIGHEDYSIELPFGEELYNLDHIFETVPADNPSPPTDYVFKETIQTEPRHPSNRSHPPSLLFQLLVGPSQIPHQPTTCKTYYMYQITEPKKNNQPSVLGEEKNASLESSGMKYRCCICNKILIKKFVYIKAHLSLENARGHKVTECQICMSLLKDAVKTGGISEETAELYTRIKRREFDLLVGVLKYKTVKNLFTCHVCNKVLTVSKINHALYHLKNGGCKCNGTSPCKKLLEELRVTPEMPDYNERITLMSYFTGGKYKDDMNKYICLLRKERKSARRESV